jgi:CheY-like chemotaxis protein
VSVTTPDTCRQQVLVAVEDPISRELVARMLHLAGFSALLAPTGERALLLLREHRGAVDWLVTSLSLPGLVDGPILRDEFQSVHPGRPALFFSASDMDRDQHPSGSLVPFSPAELVAELQTLARENAPVEPALESPDAEALAA